MQKNYDVVVIGGGMSGICAAIASARHGAYTALIHNRPVLGGNAGSEIRMHICGASVHGKRENARETGILEEILLENKRRNPQHSFSVWDTVLWEKVRFQEKLDLYLNTQVQDVEAYDQRILSVFAWQMTTEKCFTFKGKIFVDCTGDGMIAHRVGAYTRMGREAKSEYGESFAPEKADSCTMGSALMFSARDTGKPCTFEKPRWAYEISEKQLEGRQHTADGEELVGVDSGYWWIELGGTQNVLSDGEEIRDELLKLLYGIWDHIKNKPGHGAENYALDWVQFLPGRRESRRIIGDHVLSQQELEKAESFPDEVAYGGWPMDMHPPEGFFYSGSATEYLNLKKPYGIPYRCYYSQNIENLMMAGRNISATHTAFGSVRVMGTCAVGGQAVGTAAALAVQKNCVPRQIGQHIQELQQLLLRDDCYLINVRNQDVKDKARTAEVSASSFLDGWEPKQVINGIARTVGHETNGWKSASLSTGEAWIRLDFTQILLKEVLIKFDSDLSSEIMITLSKSRQEAQRAGLPESLVKDYVLEVYQGKKMVYEQAVNENGQRLCRHVLGEPLKADAVVVRIRSSYGSEHAAVYEIRLYEEEK